MRSRTQASPAELEERNGNGRASSVARPLLRWLGFCLVGIGIISLLVPAGRELYSRYEQWRLLDLIERRSTDVTPVRDDVRPVLSRMMEPGTTSRPPAWTPGDSPLATPFLIEIPRIGLRAAVGAGVEVADLRKGPGWYPQSALPGTPGNVAIAGHRTTYGSWFRHVDRLQAGDVIFLSDGQRMIAYEVERVYTVEAGDWSVIESTLHNALTLTTCTPPGGDEYRLVVRARQMDGGMS